MLTTLNIKNFIIIRDLTIDLNKGLTVITGETGSGKSIIIKAIEIGLGRRFEKQFILEQKDKCEISLSFYIENSGQLPKWLEELNLPIDDNEIIIRRSFGIDGKSKNYLNDTLISLSLLKKITQQIISIHGQHENQLILSNDFQRNILDKYSDNQSTLVSLESAYTKWRVLKNEIVKLANTNYSKERAQLLKFQIDEIESHNEVIQNLKEIENRHTILINSEDIQQAIVKVTELINNEANGCIEKTQESINELNRINSLPSNELTNCITCLKDSTIQLSEAIINLNIVREQIEHDPEELSKIENKLQKIYEISKKHAIYPHDLAEHLLSLKVEFKNLQNKENKLINLQNDLVIAEQDYRVQARALSKLRQKSAVKLSKEITQQLILLDICGPFNIKINYEEQQIPNITGLDKIEFFIKTNPDTPESLIEQIVSGGELSRISLALQAVTGKHLSVPTIIFDEVDVGISGSTAEIVGKLLKNISSHTQIICITHLAQVASLAEQHLKVSKATIQQNTITNITHLDDNARIKEIARILGGIKITQKTLQHAKEMIYQ